MDYKKKITENLQLIIAVFAVAGVVINIINFFNTASLSPLEKRVSALEKARDDTSPLITDFTVVKTKVEFIYNDVQAIKKALNIQ